ncbi:MAG: hypothetical protein RJA07_1934 [Bacteroidota bacterium]|jgi:uncharacterized membrane protein YgdD (TMEM256/DUF423 family)
MTQKQVLLIACILGALSVALGAFAAHGLKKMVDAYYLEIFEKGVKYQFYHTFAILTIGILVNQFSNTNFNLPVYLFLAGIFFFSGSLYLMTFTQPKWLGPITPIGGLCFIAGWLTMAWRVYQSK